MAKVLIISAPFFDYQISVAKAFLALGHQVKIETYDEPIHPFKGILKWRHKFAINKERLREKSRLKYKEYIEDEEPKVEDVNTTEVDIADTGKDYGDELDAYTKDLEKYIKKNRSDAFTSLRFCKH